MGGGGGRVEVVSSKGCSRLFLGSVPSLRRLRGGVQSFESMSPASSSLASDSVLPSNAPFSGLVICVTGLSKGLVCFCFSCISLVVLLIELYILLSEIRFFKT